MANCLRYLHGHLNVSQMKRKNQKVALIYQRCKFLFVL